MQILKNLWKSISGHRLAKTGTILVMCALLLALLAPVISPHDPQEMNVLDRFEPPGRRYVLGTDAFGRDVLSRVLFGARISMFVGVSVMIITGIAGVALGLAAGYYPRFEMAIMRVMDALMAFPAILLALAVMAALGPSVFASIAALSIAYTPRVTRTVRASVLSLKSLGFVEAARVQGATDLRILLKHILPNCLSPLIVQETFIFAYAILAESSLSFVGVGAPPPTPSWGNILSEGRVYMREAPWITVAPGVALASVVLGLNLLGDGLRDILDPKMKL